MKLEYSSLTLAAVAVLIAIFSLHYDETTAFPGILMMGSVVMAVSIVLMIKAFLKWDAVKRTPMRIRALWQRIRHKQKIQDVVHRVIHPR